MTIGKLNRETNYNIFAMYLIETPSLPIPKSSSQYFAMSLKLLVGSLIIFISDFELILIP